MRFQYTLTNEDIIGFNLYHFSFSPAFRRRRRLLRFVIPLWVFLLFFLFNYHNLNLVSVAANSPMFIVAILWLLFYNQFYFWRIRRSVQRMLSESSNAGMIGPQTVILSDDGFVVENEVSVSHYKLSAVVRVAENFRYFFIYTSSVTAIVIPKAAFPDTSAFAEFLRWWEQRGVPTVRE